MTQRARNWAACISTFAEAKALPFPLALGQSFDSADEDVGAKAAAVESNGLDGAIGGDEEGQYIEAVGGREMNQLDRFAGGLFYEYTSGGSVPWEAVDGGHTRGWLDSALQSQQSMMGARGDDPVARRRQHYDFAIAANAGFQHFDCGKHFSTQALHRITPELSNVHLDFLSWCV